MTLEQSTHSVGREEGGKGGRELIFFFSEFRQMTLLVFGYYWRWLPYQVRSWTETTIPSTLGPQISCLWDSSSSVKCWRRVPSESQELEKNWGVDTGHPEGDGKLAAAWAQRRMKPGHLPLQSALGAAPVKLFRGVPTYDGSMYDFFDFMQVLKWYAFNKNQTSNFEFWAFPGLAICSRYSLCPNAGQQATAPSWDRK